MKMITGTVGGKRINIIRLLQITAFLYFVFVWSMPVLNTVGMLLTKGVGYTYVCKTQGAFKADLREACNIWSNMGRDIKRGWL